MLQSSDIFSVVYVDACVVSRFLLLGNYGSASAAMSSQPIYTQYPVYIILKVLST